MSIELNRTLFNSRLRIIKDAWNNADENEDYASIADVGALLVVAGDPAGEDDPIRKGTAFQTWLLGFEFPSTFMLFQKDKVSILCSAEKAKILQQIKGSDNPIPIEIIAQAGAKEPRNDAIPQFVQTYTSHSRVGALLKETHTGKVVKEWEALLAAANSKPKQVEMGPALSSFMAVKDDEEMKIVRTASNLTSCLLANYIATKLETILDKEGKISHKDFSTQIEARLGSGEGDSAKGPDMKVWSKGRNLKDVDWGSAKFCYSPIIQSKSTSTGYDLKSTAESSTDLIAHSGVFLIATGIRYKGYCANVGRTIIVAPSKEQEEFYTLLLALQADLIHKIKDGAPIRTVYQHALSYIKDKKPSLEKHFVKNVGFGMGLEFRDSAYLLSSKNNRLLRAGMILNLSLGFADLVDDANKKYSLQLVDTVKVGAESATILTEGVKSVKAKAPTTATAEPETVTAKPDTADISSTAPNIATVDRLAFVCQKLKSRSRKHSFPAVLEFTADKETFAQVSHDFDDLNRKFQYNSATKRLRIEVMPDRVHEYAIMFIQAGVSRWAIGVEKDHKFNVSTATNLTVKGFKEDFELSSAIPDLSILWQLHQTIPDGQSTVEPASFKMPVIRQDVIRFVLEVGVSEKYSSLKDSAKLWLKGFGEEQAEEQSEGEEEGQVEGQEDKVFGVLLICIDESSPWKSPPPNTPIPPAVEALVQKKLLQPNEGEPSDPFSGVEVGGLKWHNGIGSVFAEIWELDEAGKPGLAGDRIIIVDQNIGLQKDEFTINFLEYLPELAALVSPVDSIPAKFDLAKFRQLLRRAVIDNALDRMTTWVDHHEGHRDTTYVPPKSSKKSNVSTSTTPATSTATSTNPRKRPHSVNAGDIDTEVGQRKTWSSKRQQ